MTSTPPIPRETYEDLILSRIPADEAAEAQAIADHARDVLAGASIRAEYVSAIHDREDALADLARLREEAACRVSYELGYAAGRSDDPDHEDAVNAAVASMMAAESPGRAYKAMLRGITAAMAAIQEEAARAEE